MRKPAEIVDELERNPELPPGSAERFYGYGVMGLRSSRGTCWGSGASRPRLSAPGIDRFGTAIRAAAGPSTKTWTANWHARATSGPRWTRLSRHRSASTGRADHWRPERVTARDSRSQGGGRRASGTRLALGPGPGDPVPRGRASTGAGGAAGRGGAQRSALHGQPAQDLGGEVRQLIGGSDLGEMGPAPEQAHLRDFAMPQRGLFVVGRCFLRRHAPGIESTRAR